MFSNISWEAFFICTAIATVLYYLVIGLLYFRQELQAILSGKQSLGISLPQKKSETATADAAAESGDVETKSKELPDLDQIERIINEIRYEVIPKAGSHPTKAKLAILFSNYLSTINANLPIPFKNSINQLVLREAAAQCSIDFTEAEVNQLW